MPRPLRALAMLLLAGGCFAALAATLPPEAAAQQKQKAKKGKADPKPKPPGKPQSATPSPSLKVAPGFAVELLYSVPKDQEGSWVNLCTDPKGRLITSDQYGSLYRVTPHPVGTAGTTKVEKIPVNIGMAQGLLCAFDALYVVVNAGGDKSGLFRVTDTDNDDQYDKVELLRKFTGGGGEHGPHAVIKHPDGKRLTIVCGNQTKMTDLDSSLVPRVWGDDLLLPRTPDGNGFMAGVLAPGGCIYNVKPDGTDWELVSMGYRNEFDAAYNAAGELFTYDADMEWDANTPWYRPTRVCHVAPGSDWGWRNGSGKYPVYYPDTLPPVVNIGPGSPTGICFGYGTKFPAKFQNALFICDWSYGKMYAVHTEADGSTYKGTAEEFISGSPLPLTDVVVNPADGALYFAIGGRKTQSGLYRVTYAGKDSTEPATAKTDPTPEAKQRKELDQYLGKTGDAAKAVGAAWPHLGSPDRFLRYTARTVIESQPLATWRDRALTEANPDAAIEAMLALARVSAPCPLHTKNYSAATQAKLPADQFVALMAIDFNKLTTRQKLDYVRTIQVTLHRLATTAEQQDAIAARLDKQFPVGSRFLDEQTLIVLAYLNDKHAAVKGMKLLREAPTQEEQIEVARSLRTLNAGWTPELRREYFQWFTKAGGYKGGNSFQGFVRLIKADAVATLSPEEKVALKPIIDAKPAANSVPVAAPREFVKKWTLDELTPLVEKGLEKGGRDFDKGRKLFAAANCFACHRYDNEGGSSGPDLSGIAGRFSTRDLTETILDPSKEVSDQYAAVEVQTTDGRALTGRIVNYNGDNIMINTDMLNPNAITGVNRNNIDSMKTSKLSMMPTGLFDTLNEGEILDLMAFLLSRGDRDAKYFGKK
jgi:putative heme-binding domain-containing protein